MKAVLISIQPKWCEKIANGKKTIDVRKTRPNWETPFKVYIYCTNTPRYHHLYDLRPFDKSGKIKLGCVQHNSTSLVADNYINGKVIGEFVCDRIDDFYCCSVPYKKENNLGYGRFLDNGVYKVNGWHEGVVFERNDKYIDSMLKNNDLKEMCLSAQEIFDYIGIGKYLYGWHISDLKIYDKPKELSDFWTIKCNNKRNGCQGCEIKPNCIKTITRPPQSWCYVEEK